MALLQTRVRGLTRLLLRSVLRDVEAGLGVANWQLEENEDNWLLEESDDVWLLEEAA